MNLVVTRFFILTCTFACIVVTALAQKPTPAFDASPTIGCAPLTVSFNDKSTDAADWEWDIDNNGTYDYVGDPFPVHTYTLPGTYSVRLMVSSFFDSASIVKTKYITVTAPISVSVPPQSHCVNDSFRLSATVTGGLKPYTYFWSCETLPNFSSDTQPLISVDTTQTWTLEISDSLGCTGSTSFTITAIPAPAKPTISHVGNQLSCNSTAQKYQWLLNGAAIPAATGKDFFADTMSVKTGYYQVRISNAAGCSSTSDSVLANRLTDIAESDLNAGWVLYPNPARSDIFLSCPIPTTSITSVHLMNTLGQCLRQGQADERSGRLQVNLADLPSGVYLLQISEVQGRHIFRVVKE